jgi:hypothetical protein
MAMSNTLYEGCGQHSFLIRYTAARAARCILGTLKHEPHRTDTTPLRLELEAVIERARKEGAA